MSFKDKLKGLLKSRKFWAAFIPIIAFTMCHFFEWLSLESTTALITALVSALIIGQGIEDAGIIPAKIKNDKE